MTNEETRPDEPQDGVTIPHKLLEGNYGAAGEISVLTQRILDLAPKAGLFVEITIRPSAARAPDVETREALKWLMGGAR